MLIVLPRGIAKEAIDLEEPSFSAASRFTARAAARRAGGESQEPRSEGNLDVIADLNANHLNNRQIANDNECNGGDQSAKDQLAKWEQNCQTMFGHCEGDQTENAQSGRRP